VPSFDLAMSSNMGFLRSVTSFVAECVESLVVFIYIFSRKTL